MRNLLYLLSIVFILTGCQDKKAQLQKIDDEKSLFVITSVDSLDYKIIYELNELESMNEGIYLAVIKPSEHSYKSVLSNLKKGEVIKWENDKYTKHSWLQTPSTKIDMSIFNYSPATTETKKGLEGLKSSLTKSGNYYCYFYEKDYPMNIGLYLVDTAKREIMIYQTYF